MVSTRGLPSQVSKLFFYFSVGLSGWGRFWGKKEWLEDRLTSHGRDSYCLNQVVTLRMNQRAMRAEGQGPEF